MRHIVNIILRHFNSNVKLKYHLRSTKELMSTR